MASDLIVSHKCLGDYLLLFYYNNVVIWHIMKICSEWSCFERIVYDYSSLPVFFTQFLWEVNPFNHGVQVILLCCNFKKWGLKTYFWCFDIYQFSISYPFYLRVYIKIPQIIMSYFEIIIGNGLLRGEHRHKWTCVYHCNCKMLFLIPVNNSKSKFCTRLFKNIIIEILVEMIVCLFFLYTKKVWGNKKVTILSWTISSAGSK